jgi:hypothetical protein
MFTFLIFFLLDQPQEYFDILSSAYLDKLTENSEFLFESWSILSNNLQKQQQFCLNDIYSQKKIYF